MSWIALPSDDALRSLASQIVTRPEYARFRPVEWDLEALRSLDRWLRNLGPWENGALLGGLMLVLALLLFHIVWSLNAISRTPVREAPPPKGAGATALDAQARRLAEQGHFLDAAHQMQLACIDRLLRDGILELHRHDPNRTLRRRLASTAMSEDLKARFVGLLGRLERRWFRDPRPDASDRNLYEEWRSLHERIAAAGNSR
jgi:hypothetical protein